MQKQPCLLNDINIINEYLDNRSVVVFLDFDGTLTPIADHPNLAKLSLPMRSCLDRLGKHCPTAIISGRLLSDIQEKIGIDHLYYAGNHGFEIEGPDHHPITHRKGEEFHGIIDRIYYSLFQNLGNIEGVVIEHKKFSLSIHYRKVMPEHIDFIENAINTELKLFDNVVKFYGKKVFEIRPKIDWNKGEAVKWLIKTLNISQDVLPIYIGDDTTDEDAFKILQDHGMGILVSNEQRESYANYSVNNTDDVQLLLENIIKLSKSTIL